MPSGKRLLPKAAVTLLGRCCRIPARARTAAQAGLSAGKELWELPHTALLTQGHMQHEGLAGRSTSTMEPLMQPDKFTTSNR